MMTWREGRRFQSRALLEAEQGVVQAAIDLLGSQDKGRNSHQVLLRMRQEGRIRAMDRFTFARAEERNAYGYTDECPVERYLRNARGAIIYEGTRELQELLQADFALGTRENKPLRRELPAYSAEEWE